MSTTVVQWEKYISGPNRDAHGNVIDSYAPLVPIPGAIFDPGTSYEPRFANTNRVTDQPTLFIPTNLPLDSRDFIYVDGRRYDIEGDPQVWDSGGTAWDPGYRVVRLSRQEG